MPLLYITSRDVFCSITFQCDFLQNSSIHNQKESSGLDPAALTAQTHELHVTPHTSASCFVFIKKASPLLAPLLNYILFSSQASFLDMQAGQIQSSSTLAVIPWEAALHRLTVLKLMSISSF